MSDNEKQVIEANRITDTNPDKNAMERKNCLLESEIEGQQEKSEVHKEMLKSEDTKPSNLLCGTQEANSEADLGNKTFSLSRLLQT